MKILHTLGWYFPESTGGTEVYVDGLCRSLQVRGHECVVGVPWEDLAPESQHNGIRVHRYPAPPTADLAVIRGDRPHERLDEFAAWLKQEQPDIYHQHSWTQSCGSHHLKAARRRGLKTVLTIHTPNFVCLRGTMMLFGQEPCDGVVDVVRCGECWSESRGASKWVASGLSRFPLGVSRRVRQSAVAGSAASAIATPSLVESHLARLKETINLADRVVAVSQWLFEALKANGFPESKLVLSRQGLEALPFPLEESQLEESKRRGRRDSASSALKSSSYPPLRLAFLGRWDPVKGLHVLVDAVRRLPSDCPVELTIFAPDHPGREWDYRESVINSTADDPRFRLGGQLSRDEVVPILAAFDLLAVPSQLLETGPYTVLEAQAAGVPVLGSRLGGIAEFVRDGVDGILVEAQDIQAWSDSIAALVRDRERLDQLRRRIGPVRSMDQVAEEMERVYLS